MANGFLLDIGSGDARHSGDERHSWPGSTLARNPTQVTQVSKSNLNLDYCDFQVQSILL